MYRSIHFNRKKTHVEAIVSKQKIIPMNFIITVNRGGEIRRTCPTFFVAGPTKIVFFPDQMSDIDFGVYFFTHERK